MKVLLLSPAYPPDMLAFTRGLAEVGAQVWGVGDTPGGALPGSLKRHLTDYLQVPGILDEDDVIRRVEAWLDGEVPDRVLASWEPVMLLAARLRERLGVPGMGVDAVMGFRDKVLMRERVAAAGVRVPRSVRVRRGPEEAEAWAAAEAVGFPLIFKPVAGAGSADTWRVGSREELERVLAATRHVPEASVEEFIQGEEYTYETICLDGEPVTEGMTRYYPNVLEARKNEWISPSIVSIRDLSQPHLQAARQMGRAVLKALGMGTGFTHMEWYLTPKGEAVFGEVACRSPGAAMVDLMNYTSDVDLFREWARVSCWGAFQASQERRYNVAITFKRAIGQGRIAAIEGLDGFRRRFGPWIVREDFLSLGQPRRDWQQTFLSDGHVVVRHPDWQPTLEMAAAATNDIRVYAR